MALHCGTTTGGSQTLHGPARQSLLLQLTLVPTCVLYHPYSTSRLWAATMDSALTHDLCVAVVIVIVDSTLIVIVHSTHIVIADSTFIVIVHSIFIVIVHEEL